CQICEVTAWRWIDVLLEGGMRIRVELRVYIHCSINNFGRDWCEGDSILGQPVDISIVDWSHEATLWEMWKVDEESVWCGEEMEVVF
ncbi:hypothetical protein Tco_0788395, partial [Tanacetum coccineum]